MNLLKFIPLHLTIALILGLLTGRYFQHYVMSSVITIGIIFLVFVLFYEKANKSQYRSSAFALSSLLLFYFFGLSNMTLQKWRSQNHHNSDLSTDNEIPTTLVLKITDQLRSTQYQDRYIAALQQIDRSKAKGRLLVSISKEAKHSELLIGETLITQNLFDSINPPMNPYQFNYKK